MDQKICKILIDIHPRQQSYRYVSPTSVGLGKRSTQSLAARGYDGHYLTAEEHPKGATVGTKSRRSIAPMSRICREELDRLAAQQLDQGHE